VTYQGRWLAYISRAHDAADLLHGIEVWTQTSVHCKDLLIDDGCNWQAVETVCECFPQLDVVSSLAFVVETVNSVDRCTFVIASQNEEVFGVFDLVCKQQAYRLKGLLASIDIVA